MSSSRSSSKRANKSSFEPVSPFQMFYQLTYMSAMASAGLTRSKLFEVAAASNSPAAIYFASVNTLVREFRYNYSDACRFVGIKAKSDNMKSFLLRFSDALRSGEPLADFLAREAEVQGDDYKNTYERDLESLKQWTNAFSSIVISVSLIIIIQMISSMIYSMDVSVMGGMVATGFTLAGFGAWIIYRSAPREVMTVPLAQGSKAQRRDLRLFKLVLPLTVMLAMILIMLGLSIGIVLVLSALVLLPLGFVTLMNSRKVIKKDEEFSTFLRSAGGMATSSGTTLKQALTRIDLSSFPYLEADIQRLSTRLQAQVDPEICWISFANDTGSRLIAEATAIFYGAVKIGGDPERVGYLCSLFTARTAQLRAKRRLTASTFSGLTTVMQAVVAALMIFVLSIINNFAALVSDLMPTEEEAANGQVQMSIGMAEFSPGDLQFLANVTTMMVLMLALVSTMAIVLADGGYKLKFSWFLALTMLVSGICFIAVPPLVAGILSM